MKHSLILVLTFCLALLECSANAQEFYRFRIPEGWTDLSPGSQPVSLVLPKLLEDMRKTQVYPVLALNPRTLRNKVVEYMDVALFPIPPDISFQDFLGKIADDLSTASTGAPVGMKLLDSRPATLEGEPALRLVLGQQNGSYKTDKCLRYFLPGGKDFCVLVTFVASAFRFDLESPDWDALVEQTVLDGYLRNPQAFPWGRCLGLVFFLAALLFLIPLVFPRQVVPGTDKPKLMPWSARIAIFGTAWILAMQIWPFLTSPEGSPGVSTLGVIPVALWVVLLAGTLRGNRLAWFANRLLCLLTGALIIFQILQPVVKGAGNISEALQLLLVHVMDLAVVFLILGSQSARRFYDLACLKCGSTKVWPADWIFRKIRCGKCGNIQ